MNHPSLCPVYIHCTHYRPITHLAVTLLPARLSWYPCLVSTTFGTIWEFRYLLGPGTCSLRIRRGQTIIRQMWDSRQGPDTPDHMNVVPQSLSWWRYTQLKPSLSLLDSKIMGQALLQESEARPILLGWINPQGQRHSRIYSQILIGHKAAASPWRQDTISPTGHLKCFKEIFTTSNNKGNWMWRRKSLWPIPEDRKRSP